MGCKKEIDILKQESKLSIDEVLEKKPKGCLETQENEVVEEVCFIFIFYYIILYFNICVLTADTK